MNKDLKKLAVGIGASVAVSLVWHYIPGSDTFRLASNPLAFVEHYHWGLASVLAGRHIPKYNMYLYGFGAGMVASEAGNSQPFGIGKPQEQVVPNIALGSLLTLLILWK